MSSKKNSSYMTKSSTQSGFYSEVGPAQQGGFMHSGQTMQNIGSRGMSGLISSGDGGFSVQSSSSNMFQPMQSSGLYTEVNSGYTKQSPQGNYGMMSSGQGGMQQGPGMQGQGMSGMSGQMQQGPGGMSGGMSGMVSTGDGGFSVQSSNSNMFQPMQQNSQLYTEANMGMMPNQGEFVYNGQLVQELQGQGGYGSSGMFEEVKYSNEPGMYQVNSLTNKDQKMGGNYSSSMFEDNMTGPGMQMGSIVGSASHMQGGYGSGSGMFEDVMYSDMTSMSSQGQMQQGPGMQGQMQQMSGQMQQGPGMQMGYMDDSTGAAYTSVATASIGSLDSMGYYEESSVSDADIETIITAYQMLKEAAQKIGEVSNQIYSATEYCTGNQFSVGGVSYESSVSNCSSCFQYVAKNIDEYADAILEIIGGNLTTQTATLDNLGYALYNPSNGHFQTSDFAYGEMINISPTSSGKLSKKSSTKKNKNTSKKSKKNKKSKKSKNQTGYATANMQNVNEFQMMNSSNQQLLTQAATAKTKKSSSNQVDYIADLQNANEFHTLSNTNQQLYTEAVSASTKKADKLQTSSIQQISEGSYIEAATASIKKDPGSQVEYIANLQNTNDFSVAHTSNNLMANQIDASSYIKKASTNKNDFTNAYSEMTNLSKNKLNTNRSYFEEVR